jgi:4-diphosphocytidyl-2-C-methyl-D-erythritol kinase
VSGRAVETVAQAKLNLSLRVLAREADGYHALRTIFCRLDLGDLIRIRTGGPGRSLDVSGAEVGPVEQNLAWRAALAFYGATGWPDRFAIEIDKQIPVGGGLGGGSADAAAVLRALNRIARAPMPGDDLLALAGTLGADVPFLASAHVAARAEGRGERLTALPALPARPVVLACFDEGIPTRDAYAWLDEARAGRDPASINAVADEPAPGTDVEGRLSWSSIRAMAVNDFEPVVLPRRPDIAEVRAALARAAPTAVTLMSGSGATVFSVLEVGGVYPALPSLGGVRMVVTRTASSVVEVRPIG